MRHTENEIACAVAKFLMTLPSKRAPVRDIRQALPRFIQLSADDRAPSSTRKGEEMWEQQVRNIVSHKDAEGNWINEGYLKRPAPGILEVTVEGEAATALVTA